MYFSYLLVKICFNEPNKCTRPMNSDGHQRSTYEHYYHKTAEICTPSSFQGVSMNTAIFRWIFEMDPNPPPIICIVFTIESWKVILL